MHRYHPAAGCHHAGTVATRRTVLRRALIPLSIACLSASMSLSVVAQDSFGPRNAQQPQPRPEPSQHEAPQRPRPQSSGLYVGDGNLQPAQGAANEAQDFGVVPTRQLRPSDQLGGPTPTSIPGGQVIGTQQLAQLLQGGQGNALLLHAYGGVQHLPGAIPVGPAAQGGSFDDQVQREFGQYLQQITHGDQSRAMVFYCGGVQCWGSYNAALRAIRMGYRNVAWYRGGIEAWQQAGLPVLTAGGQDTGPAPQP